ncbi:adenylate kinase isoenzyme 5 [Lepisosteus oculatus]|uniref:adenylate kinase isoenzyme 5 n=1 Tax=Lepisosteus oculatus TaxID=7918 RepID=UPI00372271B9
MNSSEAREYLSRREIPQLFESLLTGLMYYRPDDPVEYLESCLKKVRELGGTEKVRWDTFVGQEKKSLPPLNGGQCRRSFFRNVLPDSPNFPYRRYDRLPPIHQFSIESDTDLSETAELIEEYEVFDPTRPRPKIILLIGGPGSGKGTQSLKIAERYGFEYISVGELLRKKMIHNATSNRKWSLIAKIITNGELAPQETTITEIKQKIMQIPDAHGIVIDGFPRDVGQALSFEDQICTPDLVVFLACASHRLKERLERRAELQGRPDDNPKATERRLTNFKQNAIPLVKYFQEKGLIVTLDADRDEEDVFYDISVTVDNKLFPTKEPVAGPSELDLSLLVDSADSVDMGSEFEEQAEDEMTVYGEENIDEELKKLKIIFVIGGPGSGKGTQCERIAEKYGLRVLSAGDLLRGELQADCERSRLIKDILEQGELLPPELLLELVREAMASSLDSTRGFVMDGFPRDVKQAEEFEAKIAEPSLVLLMECPAETMTKRLQRRPQVDGPADDSRDTIRKRVEGFSRTTVSVTTYYEHRRLLHKVNAEKAPDEVFQQVCQVIESC